jgi:hypothetical protein
LNTTERDRYGDLENLFDCSLEGRCPEQGRYTMRSDAEPRPDDSALAQALRSNRPPSRCACCGLPAYQPVCEECADHVAIDRSDADAVIQREADHRDRWMHALAVARRHSLQDKERVANALRSRDRYRDALQQLWHLHEPKPNPVDPEQCSCGSGWPCRTAQLVDRTVGSWAAGQERDKLLREQLLEEQYQRSLNPPPSDLRPFRPPRKR